MRIDCQVHVVSPDRERYPLDPPAMDISPWWDLTARSDDELLVEMASVGIDRIVLVQPYSAYQFDNRYTADSAAAHPERFAGVCTVNLDADPLAEVRHWVTERGAKGIRLFLQRRDDDWLDQPASDPIIEEIAALGAIAQAAVVAGQLPGVRRAAQRHPDVPILVDHCGNPDLSGGPGFPNAQSLFQLADASNVRVKLSTHVFERARQAGVELATLTGALVTAFGADRVMWASDLTVQPRPYAELIAEVTAACGALSEHEREQVLGDAAAHLWWPTS